MDYLLDILLGRNTLPGCGPRDKGRGQKAFANRPLLTTRKIENLITKNCFAYAKGPYRMVISLITKTDP